MDIIRKNMDYFTICVLLFSMLCISIFGCIKHREKNEEIRQIKEELKLEQEEIIKLKAVNEELRDQNSYVNEENRELEDELNKSNIVIGEKNKELESKQQYINHLYNKLYR